MSNLQIRNVPEDLHRKLKARAALSGMSLSDYLLREVEQLAERPTLQEWLDRVARLPRVELSESGADIIRELRGPLGSPDDASDIPAEGIAKRPRSRLTESPEDNMRELRSPLVIAETNDDVYDERGRH